MSNDRRDIDRGYGFKIGFHVEQANGSAEVVAGTTAVWKLATTEDAASALITKVISSVSASGGKTIASVALTAEETGALPPGQYYHQLAVTVPSGEPEIYFKGYIRVRARL